MRVFTDHKIEWLIGVTCAFLPLIITKFISATSSIPDVKIPFWLVVLFASLPLGYLAAKTYSKKIKILAHKTYGVEKVKVSGKDFTNCVFDGTELEFDGTALTAIRNCRLSGQRITFSGSAKITMSQFISFYSDPAFRPMIDVTFENIKNKGIELEHNKLLNQ